MNIQKALLSFLILTLSTLVGRAQFCNEAEQRILECYTSLSDGNESNALQQSKKIIAELESACSLEDFFVYPFEALRMFKPVSQDGKLRVFTWNYPKEDGTQLYFGCMVFKTSKSGEPLFVKLNYTPVAAAKWDNKVYDESKWPGALYYAVVPMSKGKKSGNNYALLGFESKDNLSNYKVIEVITIESDGCKFGGNFFDFEDRNPKRVVFEYSDQVACSLRYYDKQKTIVVDHLSPRESIYEGFFPEYGPDGSYDGYVLENGKWKYLPIIDIAPFVDGQNVPFNNPRP
jgi:hypothetical protein